MPKGKKLVRPLRLKLYAKHRSQKLDGGKTPKQGTPCSVCDKLIEQSCDNNGEDAIYCEGRCGWLHRHCADLSDCMFLCIFCTISSGYCGVKSYAMEIKKILML